MSSSREHARLFDLCGRVQRNAARTTTPFLFSYTMRTEAGLRYRDGLAGVADDEAYVFSLQQPARENSGVYGLGVALELRDDTSHRFSVLKHLWRQTLKDAFLSGEESGCPGSGLIALGGFRFTQERCAHSELGKSWASFPAASLIVPQLSLAEFAGDAFLTYSILVQPQSSEPDICQALEILWQQAQDWRHAAGFKRSDVSQYTKRDGLAEMCPIHADAHYLDAVSKATTAIRQNKYEKIVLARAIALRAKTPYQPETILRQLEQEFAECFVFWVRRNGTSFIGATPELLLRREGLRCTTMSLAGSIQRGGSKADDDRQAKTLLASEKDRDEQGIVTQEILQILKPFSVWATTLTEPQVISLPNIQHLATPIRAQLKDSTSTFDLLAALHPTPAVGGYPRDHIFRAIGELEELERGWYASPLGWIDAHENAEFCVALRSAIIAGNTAHCYAGVGVVAQSEPQKELAETELKLSAMMSALLNVGSRVSSSSPVGRALR